MFGNMLLAQMLAEERVKDAMPEAEEERLIHMAKGPRKMPGWWVQVALALSSLSALLMGPRW